ncbi:MAG TPA: hypothetical protein VGA67_04640 [Candidatus Dojkabacteria bacterium]|jgi:hypothetical protein
MKEKNQIITTLAEEITEDISNNRLPLHNVMLKAVKLARLLDHADSINWFKTNAKHAENYSGIIGSHQINMSSAVDPHISLQSSNPNEIIGTSTFGRNNKLERQEIWKQTKEAMGALSNLRTETYNYALNIYVKWQFGNIAESIFERKRNRIDPLLSKILPDTKERLNSINENINSNNSEHWKNAVVTCRTLLMDIADILVPPKGEEKQKYINRLKDYVTLKIQSKTKKKLVKTYLEELKLRIEYTSDLTQGSAHQDRKTKEESEDVVLYTYLLVGDLVNLMNVTNVKKGKNDEKNT